jgi:hypothetical protein
MQKVPVPVDSPPSRLLTALRKTLSRIKVFTSAVTGNVLSVTDWLGKQLHISSAWASRAGFLALFGIGLTFIQVDEYALALLPFILSALVLFSKAVHWRGIVTTPRITRLFRVVFTLGAISFVPVLVVWTQARRGNKPWTNFKTHGSPNNPASGASEQAQPKPGTLPATQPREQAPVELKHKAANPEHNSPKQSSTLRSKPPELSQNQKLVEDAIIMVKKIRSLYDESMREIQSENNLLQQQLDKATSDEDRDQIRSKMRAVYPTVRWKAVVNYNEHLKSDAMRIRDQLLETLEPGSRSESVESQYDKVKMLTDLQLIFEDLDRLRALRQKKNAEE